MDTAQLSPWSVVGPQGRTQEGKSKQKLGFRILRAPDSLTALTSSHGGGGGAALSGIGTATVPFPTCLP